MSILAFAYHEAVRARGDPRFDDSLDDSRDDTGPLNYGPYSPKVHLSCLVTTPACC